MSRHRRTFASESEALQDVGLHSGQASYLRLCPAPFGAGLVFVDKDSGQEIPACPANVADTSRCTILEKNGVRVQTVEHVLATLAGLGIDDALIETAGGEMPAVDGSALPFVQLACAAGICEHGRQTVEPLTVTAPIAVQGNDGASVVALPASTFRISVILDYPDHAYLGTSAAVYSGTESEFAKQIAPARTYGFLTELAWLRAHGLALGAAVDNAIALGEAGYETALRFPNELARHKLLDLVGDLALVGRSLHAHILAFKPGHTLNVALARLLYESA